MSDYGFFPPKADFLEPLEQTDYQNSFSFSEMLRKKKVDLTKDGLVTPIRNQLPCNSCTSFGVTASLETKHLLETGDAIELAAGWIHRCLGEVPCEYTLDLRKVSLALEGRNVPLASQGSYPWNGNQCQLSGGVKAQGFMEFRSDKQIMNAVAQGVAVAVGMKFNADFITWSGDTVYSYDDNEEKLEHVAVIVGYDSEARLWLLKNSLGDGWGDEGYFRVKFGDCGIMREYHSYGAVSDGFDNNSDLNNSVA